MVLWIFVTTKNKNKFLYREYDPIKQRGQEARTALPVREMCEFFAIDQKILLIILRKHSM